MIIFNYISIKLLIKKGDLDSQSPSLVALNCSAMGSEARRRSVMRLANQELGYISSLFYVALSNLERECARVCMCAYGRQVDSVNKGGSTRAKGQEEPNVTVETLFFH